MKSNLFLFLLISLFVGLSCTRSKESKLEGKWEKIDVTNATIPSALKTRTIWEFRSGDLIISEIPVGVDTIIEQTRAKYNMGFNGEHYTLNITQKISGKDLNWVEGDGKIKQLNSDYFKWFNKNGFYGEFVRYKE